jgi:ABC-type nitrate/sulfonate/bicarbonate transport system substrate-binding protein
VQQVQQRSDSAEKSASGQAPYQGENMSPKEWAEAIPRRRVAWAIGVAVLALGIVVALALAFARSRAVPAPLEKLSIAVSSTPHAALLHLAAANNFFADEGLDVTLVPVSHGKAAMDLLAQGKTDLAAAAEVPFVISVLNGEPFAIALNIVSVSTEMAVVARRDRAIAQPRDLQDKKIGVTFGTSGDYFLWAFLTRHKLSPDRITLIDVPPGRLTQELARGSIDAMSIWQPIRYRAELALGENAASFSEPDAYTVTHVVVARRKLLEARPVTIQKLARAVLRAEEFNRANPQQALAQLAGRLKLDPKALEPGWEDLDLKVDLLQSQLITLEDEARWAMAQGYAPKGAVPNFLPHLYLDALLAVRPGRVTVVH